MSPARHTTVSFGKSSVRRNFTQCFIAVSLEGILKYGQPTRPTFIGFFVTAEKDFSSASDKNGVRPNDNSVGTFHFVENGMIKASERCNKVLTHTSSFAKDIITVTICTQSHVNHSKSQFQRFCGSHHPAAAVASFSNRL